jgi:adenine/guanine phosphoribosyltransferase-like PRPP-binding protein
MPFAPHDFWQGVRAPGGYSEEVGGGLSDLFPASLPDGREIALPIRLLPGGHDRAVASLIVNQASFAVEDALAEVMADAARAFEPEIVIGVPTLGLPLGTSRKFWYDEMLSEPLRSITSPGDGKRIYLDPRMLPLLQGRRFIVVDDVISTGSSLASVLRLLSSAGLRPVAAIVAMLQGERWRSTLERSPFPDLPVIGATATPLLVRGGDGFWRAE